MPLLQNLDVQWVSLVDRAAVRNPTEPSEPQRFLVTKSEVPIWKREGGATTDPEGGTMTEAELSAALEKAETERDELTAKVEKLEQDLEKASEVETPEPVEIDKSELDPRVREALDKAEARAADADARIEKAENLAKAERDARVTKEFVAKAEQFAHVAGDTSEFGRILKSASESLSKEDFDLLEQRLTAANEQIDKGELFKQAGEDGDGRRGTDVSDMAQKAEDIRKADPSVSEFEAMRRASRDQAGEQYLQAVR